MHGKVEIMEVNPMMGSPDNPCLIYRLTSSVQMLFINRLSFCLILQLLYNLVAWHIKQCISLQCIKL